MSIGSHFSTFCLFVYLFIIIFCLLILYICLLCGRLVIQTLKVAPPERRCFRMMGGVLIERTVKEILPTLEENMEQVGVA